MERLEYRDQKFSVDVYLGFLTPKEAQELFDVLEEKVEWERPRVAWKRRNVTYGDKGLIYEVNFSGGKTVRRSTIPWIRNPALIPIRDQITGLIGQESNICVVQEYPSGKVGINPHRDKEMTPGTTISGLSLGQERNLVMTSRFDPEGYTIPLPSGSLYVLNPPTNDYWAHSIAKDDSLDIRLSCTFRNYVV